MAASGGALAPKEGSFVLSCRVGKENNRFAKGAVWGDYDNDRFPDLYVSNMEDLNRLYRNNRDGTFTDVAPQLGVTKPLRSFPAWFWDFNNDGVLDLFDVRRHGAERQEARQHGLARQPLRAWGIKLAGGSACSCQGIGDLAEVERAQAGIALEHMGGK